MKYLITPGSPTEAKLLELENKKYEAYLAAETLLAPFPQVTAWANAFGVIQGGISAVEVKELPTGWRWVDEPLKMAMPDKEIKANAALIEAIKNLPVIEPHDLNSIVGFTQQHNERGGLVLTVGYEKTIGGMLLNVNEDCHFTPNADMTEILVSEWKKLRNPTELPKAPTAMPPLKRVK